MEDELNELCSVCLVNDLVGERERIEGICNDCWVDELLVEDTDEQDFDERLYAALDIDEDY